MVKPAPSVDDVAMRPPKNPAYSAFDEWARKKLADPVKWQAEWDAAKLENPSVKK